RIEDDGPGIKPEHLKQIFDPFFTTKAVGQGTGLGLSICHGIIKEHGGTIAATSTPGQGTVFTIDLPVIAGKEAPVEEKRPAGRPSGPATILVVDDEVAIRELVHDILSARGHSVDAVETGAQALEALKSRKYDLLVSDLKMPEMSGQDLYARIKIEQPEFASRVLFTSGDTVSNETQSFLEETGRPYLLKPFEVQDLIEQVERIVSSGGPDSAAARN
ncbi:MAG TPA: response regulator, partial [Candidatus Polarisedimenticolia bacterium]|nr:response regulator [Candidatus Polarisedimenticolia bacterium]